jgi:hypothetical protein
MTSATIPTGVEFSPSTNSYWVRADYSLQRQGAFWILDDMETATETRFRSEARAFAALAALV